MKNIAKFAVIAAALLGLGGCVTAINPAQNSGGSRSTSGGGFPVMGAGLSGSDFTEMCQVAKANKFRAQEMFAGKMISANGQIVSINPGISRSERFHIYLKSGKIDIHATTDNMSAVNKLSVNQNILVSGFVRSVDYDYDGCSIGVEKARF